jgi:hypothetical protein
MNEFLEFFKRLFGLSEEQVAKAEQELNMVQKSDTELVESAENQDIDKKETKAGEKTEKPTQNDNTDKKESEDDNLQSADATSNEGVENMNVNIEEYKKIQAELEAVKGILEKQNSERAAEQRMSKIKEFKDCLDFDYLSQLLDGVEEKDFGAKVEEIKKDKGYLFKVADTEGFNPATPQNKLSGVEAKFYELNPDLRPSSNLI